MTPLNKYGYNRFLLCYLQLYDIVDIRCLKTLFENELMSKNIALWIILASTTIMTLSIVPVSVQADKCHKNDNGNCNSVEKDQKVDAKNDCNIKNHNHDKSHDNTNTNSEDGLTCSTDATNENGVGSGLRGSDSNSSEELSVSSVGNDTQSSNDTQPESQAQTENFALPM